MTVGERVPVTNNGADQLLRIEEVKSIVGLGKSIIYQRMKAGTFPMKCKAGGSTRWSEREVRQWVADQLAARAAAPAKPSQTSNLSRGSQDAFLHAIHKQTPAGEWIAVQHHPCGDWSVAAHPLPWLPGEVAGGEP